MFYVKRKVSRVPVSTERMHQFAPTVDRNAGLASTPDFGETLSRLTLANQSAWDSHLVLGLCKTFNTTYSWYRYSTLLKADK